MSLFSHNNKGELQLWNEILFVYFRNILFVKPLSNNGSMQDYIYVISILLCVIALVVVEVSRFSPTYEEIVGLNRLLGRKGQYGILVDSDDTVKQLQVTASSSPNSQRNRPFPRFTVIIVTYNEPLLNKT